MHHQTTVHKHLAELGADVPAAGDTLLFAGSALPAPVRRLGVRCISFGKLNTLIAEHNHNTNTCDPVGRFLLSDVAGRSALVNVYFSRRPTGSKYLEWQYVVLHAHPAWRIELRTDPTADLWAELHIHSPSLFNEPEQVGIGLCVTAYPHPII